jgi:hypothetical protein
LNSITSSIGMTISKISSSEWYERTRLSRFDFTLFSLQHEAVGQVGQGSGPGLREAAVIRAAPVPVPGNLRAARAPARGYRR